RGAFAREPLTALGPLYTLFARKYYMDDLYNWLIGVVLLGLARGASWFDRHGIDTVVNGVAELAGLIGRGVTRTVTGRAPSYALTVFGGIAVLVAALLFLPGSR